MPPVPDAPGLQPADLHAAGLRTRLARNRGRQRELYGAPLGDRVRRLTAGLGITQGRLAQTLGVSPAMLSQLASARRVKIGDPAVLARLQLLDRRCASGPPRARAAVDALLAEVAAAQLHWTGDTAPTGSEAVRRRRSRCRRRGPHRPTPCAPSRRRRASLRPRRRCLRFPSWPRCSARPRPVRRTVPIPGPGAAPSSGRRRVARWPVSSASGFGARRTARAYDGC